MKLIRTFCAFKVVEFHGLQLTVPGDTKWLAIERYADSENAMVVAMKGNKPTMRRAPSGHHFWVGTSQSTVAIVDPGELPMKESLMEIE